MLMKLASKFIDLGHDSLESVLNQVSVLVDLGEPKSSAESKAGMNHLHLNAGWISLEPGYVRIVDC